MRGEAEAEEGEGDRMRKFQVVIVMAMALMAGCLTGKQEATEALEGAGMSNVQTGGAAWFACSEDDKEWGRKFEATNAQGKRAKGVVCCGIFKGCTVRW